MNGICAPTTNTADMLKYRLIAHEGLKNELYQDSLGYWTMGVGHLCDPKKGGKFSTNICMMILEEDIAAARTQLLPYKWYTKLDRVRADMLVEMVFNIGLDGLLKFTTMIPLIEKGDYAKASIDFLASLEAKQIHSTRANDMAYRLKNGTYP